MSLYRALTDLLGPHPYDLVRSKDRSCGFPGAHKGSVCISLREKESGHFHRWSDTSSSLSRQELQAEQQQPVHGSRGHPVHRHHKEVELGDPGPAGHRYPMAAFPDRHGEGSVPSFHVMEGRRERNGVEFKPPAPRYCLLPRLGNPSPNSSPTPSLSFLCLITAGSMLLFLHWLVAPHVCRACTSRALGGLERELGSCQKGAPWS